MSVKDWFLLFGGGILGYLGSLFATFSAAGLKNLVFRARISLIERNRQKAARGYSLIEDLKSGERDKYIYLVHSWGFVISYLIFMSTFAIIGSPAPTIPNFLLQFGALGFFFMAVRRLSILVLTMHRLENFEEYEEELEAEFPGMVKPKNFPAGASPISSAQ